jgi:hypothetical protein
VPHPFTLLALLALSFEGSLEGSLEGLALSCEGPVLRLRFFSVWGLGAAPSCTEPCEGSVLRVRLFSCTTSAPLAERLPDIKKHGDPEVGRAAVLRQGKKKAFSQIVLRRFYSLPSMWPCRCLAQASAVV